MALRHYSLWDGRAAVMYILTTALFVFYVPVIVLGVLSSMSYVSKWRRTPPGPAHPHRAPPPTESTRYLSLIDACIVTHQPQLVKACWIMIVSFVSEQRWRRY